MVIDSAYPFDRAEKAGKVAALGVGSDGIDAAGPPLRRHRLCAEARCGVHKSGAGRKLVRTQVIDRDFVDIKGATGFPHPAGNRETAQTLAPIIDDPVFGRLCPPSVHVLPGGIETTPTGFGGRELPERD